MAARYVYSGAAGAATGADWTNAHTTLAAAITASAAGDTFYVANDHAETQATSLTLTFKGAAGAIDRILCVNRAGSVPPVSADLTTGASIATTGNSNIQFNSGFAYIQGLTFSASSSTNGNSISTNGAAWLTFKNCALKVLGTGANFNFQFVGSGGSKPSRIVLDNTTLQFPATGNSLIFQGVDFLWKNTPSAIQGATLPTTLISATAANLTTATLDGVDLSALGSGKTIVGAQAGSQTIRLLNCKLAGSVTIAAAPTAPGGARVEVLNSDSAATGYRQEIYAYQATLTAETTIVRSGGASDGVQAISHKIVSTANAKDIAPFESFPMAIWNADTGVSKTLTVEIVNDGTTLTNADIWVEVEYLGSSAQPLASLASSGVADVLAAGANITTSTATWTTTGLSSPVKQKLQVSFTPQMAGLVRAVVKVAKTSKTIYVDPKITLA